MSRDIALVRAALEAAAKVSAHCECAYDIRALDPAAIAASGEVEADDVYPEEPISVVPRPSTRVTLVPKALLDERDAEIEHLRARVEELTDKALRFDLDQAGIEAREGEAVGLVELPSQGRGVGTAS